MSILIVILVISFLVIIHELGHFIVARKNKIHIEEFGFGYPPKLLTLFKWKNIPFTLNWIPIGGFVKLEGEDGPEEKKTILKKQKDDQEQAFYLKSPAQRIAVILAGAIVNFLFGMLAFSIVFSIIGIPTSLNSRPRIAAIAPASPAEKAGLLTNVEITALKVNDQLYSTKTIDEIQKLVAEYAGREVTIITTGVCDQESCQSGEQLFNIYLRTADETPADQGSMGVAFTDYYFKFYPLYQRPFQGIIYGVKLALQMGYLVLLTLYHVFVDLFTAGIIPADLAGPVGIVHHAYKQQIFAEGWISIINFAGMISINLAVLNLLPIPALDGGRAMFILLEKFFGKKRIGRIENYANYGGFALLMALIILVTVRDVLRIIR